MIYQNLAWKERRSKPQPKAMHETHLVNCFFHWEMVRKTSVASSELCFSGLRSRGLKHVRGRDGASAVLASLVLIPCKMCFAANKERVQSCGACIGSSGRENVPTSGWRHARRRQYPRSKLAKAPFVVCWLQTDVRNKI